MRAIRSIAWVLPLTLASSVCGACAQRTTPPGATATTTPVGTTPPSARAPSEAQPQAQATRVQHGAADPTHALLHATDGMPLSDPQKATVQSLEQQLKSNERDTGAAFQTFRSDLAAQVRSGAIDPTKVQIDQSAASTALQAHVAKEADTLNGLHAALEPSQRKAAVAEVRAARQAAGTEDAKGAAPDAGMPSAQDIARMRQERMTRELGLDAAQQQQVASLLASQPAPSEGPMKMMEEHRHRTDALLNAFESDTFDARTASPTPPTTAAQMVREGTDQEVAFLSRLLPILRPDQRDRLATNMEGRAEARER